MTAPHPHAIKMQLEQKLAELGATIIDIHSVTLEGSTAYAIYDVAPDVDGAGLWFEFELPREVARSELQSFAAWLATADCCCWGEPVTIH